ncbi:MAG: arginine decarboxylase [Flavobacteriales bacterium]|nr:arginine decarboxylase [Flavobacteriales bacterium]MCB9447923.1 arginine decarboxylase [Flavobacteriales bacterium]
MKNRYLDLIEQTFEFPQEEFRVENDELLFNGIRLMDIIKEYGTPLKITYLPKIGSQISKARGYFQQAFQKTGYKGNYTYTYCTKSSHFSFIIEEALKHGVHLETSSAYDIQIIRKLAERGAISKDTFINCNGYKRDLYKQWICELINEGFQNVVPSLDNMSELKYYQENITGKCKLGIRIACEEEPTFAFYTSRLGIRYTDIINFYQSNIAGDSRFELKMLNFHINTGIKDNSYYWNELRKCINVYCDLRKICPSLDSLSIGGGFPIKTSLNFEYDYAYMAEEIVTQIKQRCDELNIDVPNLYSEFGSFTVGESGAAIYAVLDQKQQNDREMWYMIDSSLITTLPDTWGINQRFILLPVNQWGNEYRSVNIGGLTCDSLDYYDSESHNNQVFMPKTGEGETLYIGFFHTGAYQESLGGYGGIQHCLIPAPQHVVIRKDENGKITTERFSKEQQPETMLHHLGY